MGVATKRTTLFDSHAKLGGKIVDFHGFELPIWYSAIQEEHIWTRNSAGVFDVSHMGLFRFVGDDIRLWLSSLSTQDFSKFEEGRCGYCHFLDYQGKIIDDMIFAVSSQSEVFGVPNSTMVGIMWEWFTSLLPADGSIGIENYSEDTDIIALQGPKAMGVLSRILGENNNIGRFSCHKIEDNPLGIHGWIQGTGYTGERGVEMFIEREYSEGLWHALVNDPNVKPVGLGARDTLRLEKGYLLSGQDFLWSEISESDNTLPKEYLSRNTAETSVPFGLDLNHNFIGKEFTTQALKSKVRLLGIRCLKRGPSPRKGHKILNSPEEDCDVLGYVTSGGPSPCLGKTGIALSYLDGCTAGDDVWVQTSSRSRIPAKVVNVPFV